jgi:hypothetical protein
MEINFVKFVDTKCHLVEVKKIIYPRDNWP